MRLAHRRREQLVLQKRRWRSAVRIQTWHRGVKARRLVQKRREESTAKQMSKMIAKQRSVIVLQCAMR